MVSMLPILPLRTAWPSAVGSLTRIGVLALQGDVREHLAVFERLQIEALPVKTIDEIRDLDGLVIPGGESTVISKLLRIFDLFEPIRELIAKGLPVFGTCAGLIMLAQDIADSASGQESFAAIDVRVRRNAFGHQVDSFETDLRFADLDELVHAAFIRAPIVEKVGEGVEVLATLDDGRIVAVRQANALGISFHPEVTGEDRIHRYFVDMISTR